MGQKAETRTQAEKVHIITCVGAAGKAFMKELDWSRHVNADGYKTKGYGALFMKPFWGQMQKAAAKKLKEKGIKGKPFLDLDRAPVHNALVTRPTPFHHSPTPMALLGPIDMHLKPQNFGVT